MAKDRKTDSGRGQIQMLPQGEPVVDHPEEEEGGEKHQQHSGTLFCCNNLCSANGTDPQIGKSFQAKQVCLGFIQIVAGFQSVANGVRAYFKLAIKSVVTAVYFFFCFL